MHPVQICLCDWLLILLDNRQILQQRNQYCNIALFVPQNLSARLRKRSSIWLGMTGSKLLHGIWRKGEADAEMYCNCIILFGDSLRSGCGLIVGHYCLLVPCLHSAVRSVSQAADRSFWSGLFDHVTSGSCFCVQMLFFFHSYRQSALGSVAWRGE